MFSGVIQHSGVVRSCSKKSVEIKAPASWSVIKLGSSVAVNGVCLTVAKKKDGCLFFDLAAETLKRTTLGSLRPGERVHLERPLQWKGRIEGHFVLGHVDGIGRVSRVISQKSQKSVLIAFPKPLKKFIVEKGSIAIDGVSLTIGKVFGSSFWVHLIPHTLKQTRFNVLTEGTKVNLEGDILAKFASK